MPKNKITSAATRLELKPVEINSQDKVTSLQSEKGIQTIGAPIQINGSIQRGVKPDDISVDRKDHQINSNEAVPVIKNKLKDDLLSRTSQRRLPDERRSITHEFIISGRTIFLTVGLYEDGRPGEIYISIGKDNSLVGSLLSAFSISISCSLQYGVPLKDLIIRFINTQFSPEGETNNKQIPTAKSILDYIFRWLAIKFLASESLSELGLTIIDNKPAGLDLTQKEPNESK